MRQLVISIFVILFATALSAQEDVVDMTGVWRLAGGEVMTAYGEARSHDAISAELRIDEQFGGVFHGQMLWDNSGAEVAREFDHGDEVSVIIKGEVMGVVDWDNRSITIVDRLIDASLWTGRLTDANTLELIGYEHGSHGFATRTRWIRD